MADPAAQDRLDSISQGAWDDSRRVLAGIPTDPRVALTTPLTGGEMIAASGTIASGSPASASAFAGLSVVPDQGE